ncbi:hypothetical protein BGZ99_003989, partial [Dissophora globulifera]
DPKDHWVMLQPGHMEVNRFMMLGNGEGDSGMVCDGARGTGSPISHAQPNGTVKRVHGDMMGSDDLGVDKGFLGSRIDEGEDRNGKSVGDRDDSVDKETDT